jgi:hypothetical protein
MGGSLGAKMGRKKIKCPLRDECRFAHRKAKDMTLPEAFNTMIRPQELAEKSEIQKAV